MAYDELVLVHYLTLTSVVFEFMVIAENSIFKVDLTLTSVVFEL